MKIEIVKLDSSMELPRYQHPGEDAGLDLLSAENTVLRSGEYKLIKTGIKIAIPEVWGLYLSKERTGTKTRRNCTEC